ncbi:hypothetical protein [Caballeronia ptereochthonis]|uniref:hypothetical protein n=1 Tax=Caballeronia ptereochthonis TaxID=1777144 RepID=UPI000B0EECE7|nr:hypothetical protein [Caballeronia ptereochthonis]
MPTTTATRAGHLPLASIGFILASMPCFAVVDALAKAIALLSLAGHRIDRRQRDRRCAAAQIA